MNRPIAALLVLASLAALIWARQSRQDVKQQSTVLPEIAKVQKSNLSTEPRLEFFELTVQVARVGYWPVTITILDDVGGMLGSLRASLESTRVNYVEGASKIKVTAPGHRTVLLPWPETPKVNLQLAIQGDDEGLFLKAPQNPETEGQIDCALRISDSLTGALLSGAQIFLDEQFMTSSSADGEASLAFKDLKKAGVLILKLKGYHDKKIGLNPGQIDELQVEPILMNRK